LLLEIFIRLFTQWIGSNDCSRVALLTFQGAKISAEFGRIQATFAVTLKVFAFEKMLLAVGCSVEGVGVGGVEFFAFFDGR
jgi:hypothetical protein